MYRRINQFDLDNIQTLKMSNKPYAYRLAQFMGDTSVPEVEVNRAMVKTVIELERIKDEYMKELLEYKMRYGSIEVTDGLI